MKKIALSLILLTTVGCAQVEEQEKAEESYQTLTPETPLVVVERPPHKYGGWYCPDNLNGFPATNFQNWAKVPVIEGRLPTKEETHSEASLMYIDTQEYPSAKALDIKLPKLAKFYNEYSRKHEYVIVIQAVEIQSDSIVGFRYLNGGNGSAYMDELHFLSERELENLPNSKFVNFKIKLENRNQDEIWNILTNWKYSSTLSPTFSANTPESSDWRKKTNVNYYYTSSKNLTNAYADKLFGCFYIQNDYLIEESSYTEKFFLLENKEDKHTELSIVCGPYSLVEYEEQKRILENWAQEIKVLSEQL